MISFEEARESAFDKAARLPVEPVPLPAARGRVLAEDAFTDMDMPAHNMSAMDGYACRTADLDQPLTVLETIPAGYMPRQKVGPGECSKIMTGAVVPEGADIVVMFEHARVEQDKVIVEKKTGRTNIRLQAEDLKKGDCVLKAGTRVTPAEIAVLAGAGRDPVSVSVMPRVGVIATGDELVEPSQKPLGAQIRNSNGYQLMAQIERMFCRGRYFGIAKDSPEELDRVFKQAFKECDVVLFSGGVSVGEFDYVPDVLRQNGIELLFEKVRIKPGKPTVFGIGPGTYLFGLPGNPVSTFVLFEVLVKPFLYRLMGHDYTPFYLQATAEQEIKRKKTERSEFIPVQVTPDMKARSFDYHGSAHIHAYTRANGIIYTPGGTLSVEAGDTVQVMVIS